MDIKYIWRFFMIKLEKDGSVVEISDEFEVSSKNKDAKQFIEKLIESIYKGYSPSMGDSVMYAIDTIKMLHPEIKVLEYKTIEYPEDTVF